MEDPSSFSLALAVLSFVYLIIKLREHNPSEPAAMAASPPNPTVPDI
jgi:hypothetical protein